MPRNGGSDYTLSDDEDDASSVSFSYRRIPGAQHHDREAASAVLQRLNDFAPAQTEEQPAPSVRLRQARKRVGPDPAQDLLEAAPFPAAPRQAPPLPPQPGPPGWRELHVQSEVALRQEPWYQFAELVVGVAGVRMEDLVQVRREGPLSSRTWPRQPRQAPAPVQSPRRQEVEEDEESPEVERSPRARQPPPQSEPSTPRGNTGKRGNPATQRVSRKTLFSGANVNEALQELENDLEGALDEPNELTEEKMRIFDRRRRALRMLQSVRDDSPAQPGATVFLNPAYVSQLRIGRDMLRSKYPDTLRNVTVSALEESEDAAGFFALLVGSLYSRGQFSGGRRPLRASDYKRYAEGAAYAMLQLRYARFDGERVTLDWRSLEGQRARVDVLAPWCLTQQGTRTASVSSVRGATKRRNERQDALGGFAVSLAGFGNGAPLV